MLRLNTFRSLIVNMPFEHQAFWSKKSTWSKYLNRADSAGTALRSIFDSSDNSDWVQLSRHDLRTYARASDLAEFVMATVIWGYPRGMRGNNVTNIVDCMQPLTELLRDSRANPVANWDDHYARVWEIKGVGLSTYTKLASFLPALIHGHRALILDDRIVRVAGGSVFEELTPLAGLNGKNKLERYPEYLACMHGIAAELDVPAEALEMFLFEFGFNLKHYEID